MIEPFVARALLAGAGVAATAGVLGCFVVWRRMAYFGDSVAHGALLGAALGLLAGVPVNLGIAAVCVIFAASLAWMRHKQFAATDTLLGIFAHSALAFGVLAASAAGQNLDLHAYLLGDILFVNDTELMWIGGCAAASFLFLAAHWRTLILMTIHEDLAASEGVRPLRINMPLMILTALVAAVSARVIGVLLIASLLIIPAATARRFAKSPGGMAALAAACGVAAVVVGIYASLHFDAPAGPAIVAAAAAIFFLSLLCGGRRYF
ncbi:MAG: metal ABC transporter permease [Gammaproteobacteria bacterium]